MTDNSNNTVSNQHANASQVLVWDLLVRIGHWLLLVLFFVAYFTDDELLTLHNWTGYGVGIYVLVRLIWGFVGPKHARFDDFAYGPASAARYLRELIRFKARRYIGHSPAGALMIFLLLICLGATTVSGIAVLAIEENAGPLAPWLGPGDAMKKAMPDLSLFTAPAHASEDEEEEEEEEENESVLGEFHEFISEFTMLLIILHIAGVALASAVTRENLARAMVTGRKRAE